MKLLVCVKQVADSESKVTASPSGRSFTYPPSTAFRMNRYDEYALEEALLIADSDPSVIVHAVSVGPERVTSTLRRALEMGAAEAFHIETEEALTHIPFEISARIAAFAADMHYDLILAGMISEDAMNAQTGPMLAEMLGYASATSVLRLSIMGDTIRAVREIDSSAREAVKLRLPALCAVQSGINRPRYPSLTNKLRARNQEIHLIEAPSLPDTVAAARHAPDALRAPRIEPKGTIIQGTPREKAARLYELLHEKTLL